MIIKIFLRLYNTYTENYKRYFIVFIFFIRSVLDVIFIPFNFSYFDHKCLQYFQFIKTCHTLNFNFSFFNFEF